MTNQTLPPLSSLRVIESSILGPAAITTALGDLGADIIKVETRGENENLVATPDNVREPANRRAQISFQ